MGRSHLEVLALSLFVASCADSTAPDYLRQGRYDLVHINGDALPILFLETPFARLYFEAGELVLNADDTFSDITEMRRDGKGTGATTTFPSDTTRGTYRIAADTVVFTTTRQVEYRMVFQASGSLVQELSGNRLTYRK